MIFQIQKFSVGNQSHIVIFFYFLVCFFVVVGFFFVNWKKEYVSEKRFTWQTTTV